MEFRDCNTIVHISNFGVNMTNDRLKKMFEKYGKISSARIMNEYEGWHRFAYVAFEDSDAADEAVIELNGQKIDDDRRIRVKTRKREKRDKPANASLQQKAESPRFENEDPISFNRICNSVENLSLNHENLSLHHPKQNGFTVFVGNLDRNVDNVKLRSVFQSCGHILDIRVIKNWAEAEALGQGKRSKGYGFVTFSTKEEAERAIAENMNRLVGTQYIAVSMAHKNNISENRKTCQDNFGAARSSHGNSKGKSVSFQRFHMKAKSASTSRVPFQSTSLGAVLNSHRPIDGRRFNTHSRDVVTRNNIVSRTGAPYFRRND